MKQIITLFLLLTALTTGAVNVKTVRYVGPFNIKAPVVLDSINNKQEKFSVDKLIDTPLAVSAADKGEKRDLSTLNLKAGTLNMIGFDVNTRQYVKSGLTIKGAKKYKVFADGKEVAGEAALQPGYHRFAVKFIADSTTIDVTINNDKVSLSNDGKHPFTLTENMGVRVTRSASLSASGRWAIISYSWFDAENKSQQETMLCDLKTGQKREMEKHATWMPQSERYYYTEKESGKTRLLTADPATGSICVLSDNLPGSQFVMSPTEDFIILMDYKEGPKKEDGVFEIIHPDDRQPGWRSRYSISRMDLNTGFVQPLLYTYRQAYAQDISQDGKHILLSVTQDSLTIRPSTLETVYDMNLETMEMKKLIDNDGFIRGCTWAQGTDYVVCYGGTEAFNGIGNRVPEGKTPNMYDYHLYVLNTKTLEVKPVTADDKTSIESVAYSTVDGNIYYTAQNGDSVSLYRMSLKDMKSVRIAQPLEVLNGFDIAAKGGNIIVHGSSTCVPYEVYNISQPAAKPKATKVLAPNAEYFADVKLGTVKPWKFMSERGYEVTGFYFLPADFDESKKYPVIVHYYGGCSPTSRRFNGGAHYPAHYWNALGYIVFIVNPSGASGFGQEWASRHVNTMGEGPAQDIIDATRQFAKDVPQVDADKIGGVSASYGGFMTQYMLTKDNPFACGISHAGISDHTSYWGEGYWGYSYSQVSAANSYPWTRKDLYVDRSPLYNADKIKKPLLFTHGTADTNVPIGESIQMYTALKLLGTPTAFVQVEGENHGIMDPTKRIKWINTMVAWFQRWLQDDDSWWNAIYEPKTL